ncbi:hypothetical protein BJ322DRAFT_1211799 [Thelephora terrestris]|uniref:F-box domain-containing protein n=1 Tax=Thelephora terrestris TaxID=56493 RepID=A0A9P6L5S3_9AGAM|nr:hypothetical protein BJ322DRAFT_1211799 [Thelephora terrestris]
MGFPTRRCCAVNPICHSLPRTPLPMDTHTYPGRGLSLSQLIFALNEELKRAAYSPPFTLKAVSQLDRDASLALATVREWRNSFARVNRIPMDILTLIPAYLPTQKDRFDAASVCCHWRGVLLKHGPLWSQLYLIKGEECVSTLLERARGSALDVITRRDIPISTIRLISSRAERIRHLEIIRTDWEDVITFSGFNSGQLPLLRTLKIDFPDLSKLRDQPNVVIPPSPHIFGGSIDLEEFVFNSWKLSFLGHFVFPRLTTFVLRASQTSECSALYLLEFLKALPMLQTVKVNLGAGVVPRGVPEELVVVLPNVETFSLHIADDLTTQVYNIAAHILCPRARYASLAYSVDDDDMSAILEAFPTSVPWNTIVHQYITSPIDEVALEVKRADGADIESSLTFRSSDATAISFGFNVDDTGIAKVDLDMPRAEMGWEIFSKGLTTIRDHPLLTHAKQLCLEHRAIISDPYMMLRMAEEVRELFGSLGPLDKLTISGCDLHIFVANFLDHPVLDNLESPIVFPQINELIILHPLMEEDRVECMDAIVELTSSQHARGIPFDRVAIRMLDIPAGMEEALKRWVGVVDCFEKWYWQE